MAEAALGNQVVQVGIMVDDIEAKARAWSDILGLPLPNIIVTDEWDKTQAEYRGRAHACPRQARLFQNGEPGH